MTLIIYKVKSITAKNKQKYRPYNYKKLQSLSIY